MGEKTNLNTLIQVGTSKYRWLSENEIEMFVTSWWNIEYDTNILHSKLEQKGKDPNKIKKIIIHLDLE